MDEKESKSNYMRIASAVFIVICVIAITIICIQKYKPEQSYDKMSVGEQQTDLNYRLSLNSVHNRIHDEVRKKLKSPSTAQFVNDETYKVVDYSSQQVYIEGSLDAQNSFGAMLRGRYRMLFTLNDDKINILSIDIQ